MSKTCSTCKACKPFDSFPKNKSTKTGFGYECKLCARKRANEYYKKNRGRQLAKAKVYRDTHKEKIKEYRQRPESRERARVAKRSKRYKQVDKIRRQRPENKSKALAYKRTPKYKEYRREYRRRPEVKARAKELRAIRLKDDSLYVAKIRIRNLIKTSIRTRGYNKKSRTTDIVGCDFEALWRHLLNTWKKNYNSKWNGEPYHIDHIIPLSTAKTEEDVIRLCHYTNLQMLTPEDNLSKGDKLDYVLSDETLPAVD